MVDFKWTETRRANGLADERCQYLNRVTVGTTQSCSPGRPRVNIIVARYAYDLWNTQVWAGCDASKHSADRGSSSDMTDSGTPTVFIVDDDAVVRAAIQGLLKTEGLRSEGFATP